ncbi:MAG: type II toxin-antitoxin system RelB/DinJ family antitoxin [bacterium]|nr:type II toxin-antitoxin system RelB/DinJ family antitoxin [bacterium]
MSKSATIRARIEPGLKNDVDKIFETLGFTATEAITLFYNMVKLKRGIPFDVRIPNEETQKVIRNSRKDIYVSTHQNLNEYFDKIDMEMNA